MKKIPLSFLLIFACLCVGGCQRRTSDVWENTKTAMRYFNRNGKFWLKDKPDSRQVATSEAFYGPEDEEFIPLKDRDIKAQHAEFIVPQSKADPGARNSNLPGIDGFLNPSGALASIFRTVYFNTDEHVLRVKEYNDAIVKIADYLKRNPQMFIFVAGHCDERASEAYNLALGTRRSNFVRTLLVKYGADPQRIFTISYGKERPFDIGHDRESWNKNRRVEFKIFPLKKSNNDIKS